ncbi:MAG: SusC/RagA family TonB-linked outer membrane protein, partial [Paludibacter sp.]
MKRHKYLILFTLLFATSYVFSQQKVKDEQTYIKSQNGNISGFISDENGEPIIGASVIIKGSKVGTVSDVNGKFSLIGSSSDALTVSYLGYYTQTKKMNGQLSAKIILEEDSKNLDEVVVVGYGSAKKATLTGSISSIKSNEILTTKSSKLVYALQGKVSGVLIRQASGEPGKFSSMLSIRGFGTPLIVIDGVVRDGITEFERLNQEDIESISVLKDASAAVYGMNADNGVIIVTTKRGTKGKASISYSGNYGINIPTSMIQMMDLSTQAQINNEKDRNDKITARYSNDELAKYIAGTEIGYQNIDWLNLGLKKSANSQQHNVNIQGGNDDVTYFTSLGYSIDKGLLITDIQKYEKFNLRAGFSAKISKDLTADVTISGRKDYNKSTYNGYIWAYQPLVQARRDIGPYSTVGDGMYSSIPGISGNPLAFMDESTAGYSSWNTVQFQSTASLTYKVPWLSGLSIKALGAFDGDNLQTGTLTKAYTVYDYKTGAPTVPSKPTNLTDSCHFLERTNFQIQASYNKTFAKNHNIFATIVFDQRNIKYKSISAKREWTGLYISDIIDQGSPTSNATNAGSYSSQAYQSFIGRLNYDFKGKYLVEFAFREDGSYRYAPGKRWGLFPSGSCGWRVSEENFFKNMFPSVTNLKFRASYGLMGKDAGSAFQYYSGYTGSSVGYIFNDGALTNGLIYPGVINDN